MLSKRGSAFIAVVVCKTLVMTKTHSYRCKMPGGVGRARATKKTKWSGVGEEKAPVLIGASRGATGACSRGIKEKTNDLCPRNGRLGRAGYGAVENERAAEDD